MIDGCFVLDSINDTKPVHFEILLYFNIFACFRVTGEGDEVRALRIFVFVQVAVVRSSFFVRIHKRTKRTFVSALILGCVFHYRKKE